MSVTRRVPDQQQDCEIYHVIRTSEMQLTAEQRDAQEEQPTGTEIGSTSPIQAGDEHRNRQHGRSDDFLRRLFFEPTESSVRIEHNETDGNSGHEKDPRREPA